MGTNKLFSITLGVSLFPIKVGRLGPYISKSNKPTLNVLLNSAARLTAIVDFPTPPFPLETAIMFLMFPFLY